MYKVYQRAGMELSSPVTMAMAIAFFFVFLVCCYLKLSYSPNPNPNPNLPPEAGGARPILGHLHLMGGTTAQPLHITLAAVADKCSPIFSIRLGAQQAVVVSSWKIAKELFTTCDIAVSSRPKLRASKLLTYDFAMFGFAPYGPYWRELRKLVTIELLSSRRVELLSHVCVSEIALSIKEMYTLWEQGEKDGCGRVLVDLKKWFGDLNLNMILRIIAGKRFGGDDAEEMRRCGQVLNDFFKLAGMFVVADALPWLRWFDFGGYEKRMKKTAKELDGIAEKWVEEHRHRLKENFGDDDDKDFIDVMLSAARTSDFGGQHDADTVIKSTCLSMILGGSETSSTTLTWMLSLLLNNRHVLIKAQKELDKHVERGKMVKVSNINKLVYLQSIIKETLRLYPPGPLGSPRVFERECNIEGYCIPKRTWLIINLWKMQRDSEVWPNDPLEFKPERFTSTHRNMDVKGHDFELMPFGAGRRICPAVNLSMFMLNMVMANLLQAFEITTISDESVDLTESVGLTSSKSTPLKVLIAPRASSSLY